MNPKHLVAAVTTAALVLVAAALTGAPRAALAHHSPGHGGGGTSPTATPTSGGGPLDAGWVYYYGDSASTSASSTRTIFRSSPDGTVQGAVPGAPAEYDPYGQQGWGAVGAPSDLTHDGDRWYLAIVTDNGDIVFPGMGADARIASEIDVVREGDTVGTRLTDNRGSCIALVPGTASTARPIWVANAAGARDTAVSWVGVQWADQDDNPADCETFVGAGVFRADLIYTGGAVTGMGAPVLAVPLAMGTNGMPALNDFSWAPDASAVAYTRSGGLMRAAAGSPVGNHTQLVAGSYGDVEWSRDQDATAGGLQSTIAFTGRNSARKAKSGVWGIQPSGSGLALLAEATQGTTSYVHFSPMWSPTGSHLAYVETGSGGSLGFPGIRQVRRMAKNGSGNVVLVAPGPMYNSVLYGLKWTDVD